MKKIGILTFHNESNYGAFLQTYALSETLKRLGHKVWVIDLRLPEVSQNKIKKLCKNLIVDRRIFSNARQRFLNVTSETYYSSEDLRNKLPEMDLYVVGSDQVWNKEITGKLQNTYFFDFLPDLKKRISYAASFGKEEWIYDTQETMHIKKLLERFDAISVRELSAVKLCQEQLGLAATRVLDPTLLLDDYSFITRGEYVEKNVLACFKFEKDASYYTFVRKFEQLSGNKAILLDNHRPIKYLRSIYFPTVKEWLCTIGSANFVITDSFHGLCFSILFRKQFIVIPGCEKRFVRLRDLLEMLGLTSRIFNSYQEVWESDRWKEKINYEEVFYKLKQLRKDSIDFLNTHLAICE